MATLSNISRRIFLSAVLQRNCRPGCRLISTSGKKEDADKACDTQQVEYKKIPDFSKPLENKNWVSFGFDNEDRDNDRFAAHFGFFCVFSLLICVSTFICMYFPDRGRQSWAKREAFIRLHEREQLGLELIDPNYIDPSKIVLPPDEELKEEDIVI